MLEFFKALFSAPVRTSSLDEVRPGRVILEGILQADGDRLQSPIKNTPCLAFYYQAFCQSKSRGGMREQPLRQAEVYAPRFAIELEGGRLAVIPAKPGRFEPNEHQQLMSSRVEGFKAEEQLIRAGDRVRIQGTVRQQDGELYVQPDQIEILEAGAGEKPPRSDAKQKKGRR